MEINSYAKINITLDVLRKRADGYHDVKMIMQTISLSDNLWINKIPKGIKVHTNLRFLPTDDRNIAYKAAELFFKSTGITDGAEIKIKKNIPVAAGLAGGSSNAAAVLKCLNKIYCNVLSQGELLKLGEKLGADVPFCITGGTALAEGKGEILTKIADMPKTLILAAKPNLHVSTPWVYKNLTTSCLKEHPDTAGCIKAIENKDIHGVAVRMYNVLETVTMPAHPVIDKFKKIMLEYGCIGCVMSGSGPTVIGMYDDINSAAKAKNELKKLSNDVFLIYTLN